MSKIKKNEKVMVKNDGRIGTVVAIEKVPVGGKRIRVEYVVRLGNGFENYEAFDRKQISKLGKPQEKSDNVKRTYSLEHLCLDGRVLTLVGIVGVSKSFVMLDGVGMNLTKKYLSIGCAICHPNDDFDSEVGYDLAYRRAYTHPFSFMESPFMGEFREDNVNQILSMKAKFIEDNISKFVKE